MLYTSQVDIHNLIHLLDLHLHLIQILKNVYQLLITWVTPFSVLLLDLGYLLPETLELLDVLA